MFRSLRDGYRILVLGASGGIGRELCNAIEKDDRAGGVIRASRSTSPSIDYGDEASLAQFAEQIASSGEKLDGILIATGILNASDGSAPEKAFSQVSAQISAEHFQTNATGPALAIKYFTPLLRRDDKTIVMALSARVGSIGDNGLGGWISYRASKAALNQIMHTAAIELNRKNAQNVCVALHPGTIETELSRPHARGKFTHTAEECANNLISVLDNLSSEQTGGFFDYAGRSIAW